jgi:hypothetical protein
MLETNEPPKAAAGLAGSSKLETISRSGAVLHVLSTATDFQGIRVSRVDGSHAQLIDPAVGGDRLGYPAWRPKS